MNAVMKKMSAAVASAIPNEAEKAMALVVKAKIHVQVYHPFFGALLERLKLKSDPRHPTMYTDAVVIGFRPSFVLSLQWEALLFIMIHEVMHCALRHPFRRGNRDKEIWGEAIDHACNLALLSDPEVARMRPQPDSPAGCGLADPRFLGLAAEQIYSILFSERSQQESGDEPKEGDGDGQSSDQELSGATGKAGDCLDAGASGEKPEHAEEEEEESDEQPEESSDSGNPDWDSRERDGQQGESEESDDASDSDDDSPEHDGGSGEGEPEEDDESDDEESGSDAPSPSDSHSTEEAGDSDTQRELSPDELAQLEREWSEAVSTATLAAGGSEGGSGEAMVRALGAASQVRRSFDEYVDEFAQRCVAVDDSWKRPNRRYSSVYMPSRAQPGVKKLIAGVDTSGSISGGILKTFEGALERIADQFGALEVEVVYCDNAVRKVESFKRGDTLSLEGAQGGGGTQFDPVFAYAKAQIEAGEEVAGVIYLTDLEGYCYEWQEYAEIETLWVSTALPSPGRPFGAQQPEFGRVCSIHD